MCADVDVGEKVQVAEILVDELERAGKRREEDDRECWTAEVGRTSFSCLCCAIFRAKRFVETRIVCELDRRCSEYQRRGETSVG